jgi:hypothetical protein
MNSEMSHSEARREYLLLTSPFRIMGKGISFFKGKEGRTVKLTTHRKWMERHIHASIRLHDAVFGLSTRTILPKTRNPYKT